MIVVADTSPLNYLILISEVNLLPALYERVLIPQEVHRELGSASAPSAVRAWTNAMPEWCEVREVKPEPDPSLIELDPGERDAIQLALSTGVDTLLMDEIAGRRAALRHNLRVTGTVAVLEKAAALGLVQFRDAYEKLDRTNFRLSPAIRDEFFRRNP